MKLLYSALLINLLFSTAMVRATTVSGPVLLSEKEFHPRGELAGYLLAPFYVPEYLLRGVTWPLKQFVEYSERVHLLERAKDFFSNADRTIWLYPMVTYSSSDGLSAGAHFRNNDFLRKDKRYRIGASSQIHTNGDAKSSLFFKSRPKGSGLNIDIEMEHENDSNERFYGVGKNAREQSESVFSIEETSVELELEGDLDFMLPVEIIGVLGYSEFRTSAGESQDELSVERQFPEVFSSGFGERIDFLSYGVEIVRDDSFPKGHPYRGSYYGLRFENFSPIENKVFGYNQIDFKYRKFINLSRQTRVLAIGLHHRAVSDAGKIIPFNRLAQLGKRTLLRGFDPERFADKKFVVANLEYRYPIWETLHPFSGYGLAKLFYDVGKTFDRFENFEDQKFQQTVGVGLSVTTIQKFLVEFELAYGGESLQFTASLNRSL